MPISLPSHPSSQAFELIHSALQSDPAEKKDAIKKGGAIFGFTLKNADGKEESWYIDLKQEGVVGRGTAPEGCKADVTLIVSDVDFGKLVQGKQRAQNLFMQGKLKIRGDIMKATRLDPILQKAQTKAKL